MTRRPSASKRPPAARLKLVRREYLGEIARTHILDAAEQVLADKGLDATIKEIAERADYSAGAIYGFFDSKDEIVARVFERHEAAFLDAMGAAAAAQVSARERLHRLFDAQIDYFKTHPNFYKLFDRIVRSRSWTLQFTGAEQSSPWYRRALEIEADVFRAGMAGGRTYRGRSRRQRYDSERNHRRLHLALGLRGRQQGQFRYRSSGAGLPGSCAPGPRLCGEPKRPRKAAKPR